MPTTVINIKTDTKIKKEAKKVASEMGLTLSAVINAQLRQFVKNKSIYCSLGKEVPTELLLKEIIQAKKDRAKCNTHSFERVDEAIDFLDE